MATAIEMAVGAQIREAADLTRKQWGDRVFLSHLYATMRTAGLELWEGITLPEFKEQCLTLHRTGALRLTRCDLAGAVDQRTLRDSEVKISEYGATFHFLALD